LGLKGCKKCDHRAWEEDKEKVRKHQKRLQGRSPSKSIAWIYMKGKCIVRIKGDAKM